MKTKSITTGITTGIAGLVALTLIGCSAAPSPEAASEAVTPDAAYLLAAEPADARNVIEVRAEAEDQQPVTVVGRIGGSVNPWIEGQAAFTIVDTSLKACSDREGDDCAVPWDYCCDTDRLPHSTALVKIVDTDDQLVARDARQLLGVKELQTVVVQGKAVRDDAGNLTIVADKLFVKS